MRWNGRVLLPVLGLTTALLLPTVGCERRQPEAPKPGEETPAAREPAGEPAKTPPHEEPAATPAAP